MKQRHEDPRPGQDGLDADWLTCVLETEAERYSPDGRRIRAAMHERMRGRRRRALPRIRLSRIRAGIATAVLVAAVTAVVVAVETGQLPAGPSPTAASSELSPASQNPVAGSSRPADRRATQGTAGGSAVAASPTPIPTSSSPNPSARTSPKLMSTTGVSDVGTSPYWSQEEVWVSFRAPVTELQLTVKVARGAGVASTGYWTTYTPAFFDVTVAAQATTVTYVFTLKPGHTLPAGNSTFAVQFNHWTQHDPAIDTYDLSVTSDEQHAAVRGEALGAF